MKKFSFSLQSVLDYATTLENTQKAELSQAQALINKLLESLRQLEEAYTRNCRSQEAAVKRGVNLPEELGKHDTYFRYLREEKSKLATKIATAEKERDKCRERLISTMKQIKVYSKLRQEQYAEYLHEVKLEEEKEISDIVSFKTIKEEDEQYELTR